VLLLEELLQLQLLLISLILLFDLAQLLFLMRFVAARDVLVPVLIECLQRGLQIPDLFQQEHVLRLRLRSLLTLPEHPSRRFRFSERGGHALNLLLPLLQMIVAIGSARFDGAGVLVIFLLRQFVGEAVLVVGAGGDDEWLH
jgi:hypothetical protein